MKKLYALLCASLALFAFAALAFVNNLAAVVNWWRAFAAAGGNSAEMAEVAGFIKWLNWSAVDYSAVTTFIPALGFCCTSLALMKLIAKKRVSAENFPFFKGSDQLNVALGLFGTLWGIIVLGSFDLKTVSMGDLMMCLHTALFSTLMAVVWVFMIDRPLIRPYFVKLLEECELADSGDGDLAGAVDRFILRLSTASDEFSRRQKEYEETSARRIKAFEEEFAARQKAYAASFEERAQAYAEAAEKLLKNCESSFEERQRIYSDAFEKRFAAAEEAFSQRERAYAEAFAKQLTGAEEAFSARYKAYEEAFEKRLAQYAKEFDKRQKEYVEFFKRRIDELQKKVEEEKFRADGSAAKLAAVASLLK